MKKLCAILVLLAVAGAASGETIWAVSDDYMSTGGNIASLCSFESTTGAFITAPTAPLGAKVGQAFGLTVAGNSLFLAYVTPGSTQNWIRVYDISTGTPTQIADVQFPTIVGTANRIRSLVWDGSKMYTAVYGQSTIYEVALSAGLPTGAITPVASWSTGVVDYWCAGLMGKDPTTGKYYGSRYHQYGESWDGPYSGPSTASVNLGPDDYGTGVTIGADGTAYMCTGNAGLYNIYTFDPDGGTIGNPAYDIEAVNGYSFGTATGFWGMSPVGPAIPEPATMGLLLVGVGALLRRRRH